MSNFKQGDEVYLDNGSECDYISKVDGGHVVNLHYMDEAGTSEPLFAREVFSEPPTEKYDKKIQGIKEDIERLRNERTDLLAAINTDKHELYEVQKRVADVEALKHIFDFIDGKITHYVVFGYHEFEIIERGGIACKDIDAHHEKLLTLYGRSNGDLCWKLSHYSDGSGGSRAVYPYQSLQEAKDKLAELCEAVFQDYRDSNKKAFIGNAAKALEKIGGTVPDDIADAIRTKQLVFRKGKVKDAELELKKCVESLGELGCKLSS